MGDSARKIQSVHQHHKVKGGAVFPTTETMESLFTVNKKAGSTVGVKRAKGFMVRTVAWKKFYFSPVNLLDAECSKDLLLRNINGPAHGVAFFVCRASGSASASTLSARACWSWMAARRKVVIFLFSVSFSSTSPHSARLNRVRLTPLRRDKENWVIPASSRISRRSFMRPPAAISPSKLSP